MPGPPPKPPGQRRRGNITPPPKQLVTRTGRPPAAPEGLSPAGRAWWRDVWTSPVASAWLASDKHLVVRLARLLDRIAEDEDGGYRALAEARSLEDRLGLSPLARLRLQWREPEGATQAKTTPARGGKPDDRFLRVVS